MINKELIEVFNSEIHVARKDCVCSICLRLIPKGEKYAFFDQKHLCLNHTKVKTVNQDNGGK